MKVKISQHRHGEKLSEDDKYNNLKQLASMLSKENIKLKEAYMDFDTFKENLKSDISQLVLTYTSLKLENINKLHDEEIEYLNKAWKTEVKNLELEIKKLEDGKNTTTSKN